MRLGATRPRADGAVRLMAVPPNVPLVSGALRGDSSPFLRFRLLLGFGPCGAQPDYGSRGWGFESSWAHHRGQARLTQRENSCDFSCDGGVAGQRWPALTR